MTAVEGLQEVVWDLAAEPSWWLGWALFIGGQLGLQLVHGLDRP